MIGALRLDIYPADKNGPESVINHSLTAPDVAKNSEKRALVTVFPWLLRLRWGAVACQTLLIIAGSVFLNIKLPWAIVFVIITFQAGSNLLLAHFKEARQERVNLAVVIIMFLDVSLLTLLIYYTGGPMNPFTFLYLVHIVIGALIMRPGWSWALAVFTSGCYAVLFLLPAQLSAALGPRPVCHNPSLDDLLSPAMQLHLKGMWLAFAITSIFIVFFVSKIQAALDKYQQTINRLQRAKDHNAKLASLATLAAGAAHELSTPLAAVAVAAGEMQHSLRQDGGAAEERRELLDDANFIKKQIKSCKDILYQMSSDAGQPMGEPAVRFDLAACLREIVSSYDHEALCVVPEDEDIIVKLPPQTFRRIVRSLINNSLDACSPQERIIISWRMDNERIDISVSDEGGGMDKETLARAAEPFFTTKAPGRGLGLGLFLAKTVARRYGGDLQLQSNDGGTRVVWSFARVQQ